MGKVISGGEHARPDGEKFVVDTAVMFRLRHLSLQGTMSGWNQASSGASTPCHATPPGATASRSVNRRFNEAQLAFIRRVQEGPQPWLEVEERAGLAAAQPLFADLCAGGVDPRTGHVVVV
jgi:hypothetical protein